MSNIRENVEKQIFSFMLEWKVWKIYIWDDFHSDGSNARWDGCFAPIKPDNKACREYNFANLVAMDDWHFERLVRSLPKIPNEDIVREWRKEMRKDPLVIQAVAARQDGNDVFRDRRFRTFIWKSIAHFLFS